MDTKIPRGFMQKKLLSLCPFAVAVDRNFMHAAEVADTQLGLALCFGRAYSEPVEKWGDAVIGYASELANQLHGRDGSLPAILPRSGERQFAPLLLKEPQRPTNCHASQASRRVAPFSNGRESSGSASVFAGGVPLVFLIQSLLDNKIAMLTQLFA